MEEDNGLFPAADLPEFEEEEDSYDSEYRPSFAWDLEKGDFVLTKSHGLSQSEGIEAYKTWCVKTAATQRGSCLAYDDDIGVDMEASKVEHHLPPLHQWIWRKPWQKKTKTLWSLP